MNEEGNKWKVILGEIEKAQEHICNLSYQLGILEYMLDEDTELRKIMKSMANKFFRAISPLYDLELLIRQKLK